MGFESEMQVALRELKAAGLLREPPQVSGAQGPEITIDGRSVLCFCSNNYLGLANDPRIVEAAQMTLRAEGAGSAASRLITGTMDAHLEAEQALAEFLGTGDAALFSSGYAANVGTIQALVGPGDALFSDALNHASLIDGCRLSRAAVHVYRHCDLEHLERLLRDHRGTARRALIVTDALFSMDGDLAPLEGISSLARAHDAGLLVDEAHALGVLGPAGRGASAATNVEPEIVIGTLGKSFGVVGAFAAASKDTVALIKNRARSFVYSTAPPPAFARAAMAALPLVRAADDRRRMLLAHASHLRMCLRRLDLNVPHAETQIIPVMIGENDRTMRLSRDLLKLGVFVQGIRPPTVPEGSARLRLTPMATHRADQIERAVEAFSTAVGPW